MLKYCIYYITTGKYINDAYVFFESLKYFMPNSLITVIWLSDNFIEVPKYNNIDIIQKYILDMPWPLVTLLKMHYIYENKLNGYDGYFYFNANVKILEMNQNIINIINNGLKNNKLITTAHTGGLDNNYKQACFWGGNYNIFFKLCEYVINIINGFLKENNIPEWHDETVLNLVIQKYFNNNIITELFGWHSPTYSFNDLINKGYNKIFFELYYTDNKKDK